MEKNMSKCDDKYDPNKQIYVNINWLRADYFLLIIEFLHLKILR
jgi:hypothetical protein